MLKNRFERHPVATLSALILGLLVGVEGALRLANPSALAFVYEARQVHRYSRRWGVALNGGTLGHLRLDGGSGPSLLDFVLTVGPDGFRTTGQDPSRPQADGRFIHAVGDSYTMGWGVDDAQSYPALLDTLLPSGPKVLNLGVDGFGTFGATERSMELADRFPPILAIYLFVPNDFEDDERARAVARRPALLHIGFEALDDLRRVTYVANLPFALKWHLFFRQAAEKAREASPNLSAGGRSGAGVVLDPDPAALPPVDPNVPSLRQLAAYDRFLKERRARLTVLVLSVQGPSLACYRFCCENAIETHLIELPEELRLPGDGHFNVAGNRWLAGWLRDHVLGAIDETRDPREAGP